MESKLPYHLFDIAKIIVGSEGAGSKAIKRIYGILEGG
jgi:hypothetical protein